MLVLRIILHLPSYIPALCLIQTCFMSGEQYKLAANVAVFIQALEFYVFLTIGIIKMLLLDPGPSVGWIVWYLVTYNIVFPCNVNLQTAENMDAKT